MQRGGGGGGGRGAAVGGEQSGEQDARASGATCDGRHQPGLPPRRAQEPGRRASRSSQHGLTLAAARSTDRRGPTHCYGLKTALSHGLKTALSHSLKTALSPPLVPRLLSRLLPRLLRPAKAARRASAGEGGWRARGRWYAPVGLAQGGPREPAFGGACHDEEPFPDSRPRRVGRRRLVRSVGEPRTRGGIREAARGACREGVA